MRPKPWRRAGRVGLVILVVVEIAITVLGWICQGRAWWYGWLD